MAIELEVSLSWVMIKNDDRLMIYPMTGHKFSCVGGTGIENYDVNYNGRRFDCLGASQDRSTLWGVETYCSCGEIEA